ncbi:hypothetical protein EYV94_10170 [Puteibacter caeruleilacunae]|nr:hypothetical protein EYV94_10170 [Puteibacter caeruleilacunae]
MTVVLEAKDILFEDESLIVVNKPIDLPVHKNDFMPHDAPYLTKLVGDYTGKWIYNVHRLDSKTSGVIVLALDSEVASNLTKQFEQKVVRKVYNAIVLGEPGECGTFDQKVLVKKKGKIKKNAKTHFKTLKTIETGIDYKETINTKLSLVEIELETGRWHQIRQHFAKNHHDLLGDTHHGDFTLNKIVTQKTGIRRLFLHACELEINHPTTGERMSFKAPLPTEFNQIIDNLSASE